MVDRMKLARSEVNTLSHENLEYRKTHFSWRSEASAAASPWGVATTVSAVWRGMAKRTMEAAAITARPTSDSAQHRMVQMHARALTKTIRLVSKTATDDLEESFTKFATSSECC